MPGARMATGPVSDEPQFLSELPRHLCLTDRRLRCAFVAFFQSPLSLTHATSSLTYSYDRGGMAPALIVVEVVRQCSHFYMEV
jgi:hypothetical protein